MNIAPLPGEPGYRPQPDPWEPLTALRFWNAPDDEHTRIQLRALIEAVIAETFTEHDDTATQDPDTGAAQGGPAGQTGASHTERGDTREVQR